jgi:hypothetical protein
MTCANRAIGEPLALLSQIRPEHAVKQGKNLWGF